MLIRLFGEKGQALVEYVYVLMMVALVVFLMLGYFGHNLYNYYSYANSSLPTTP